MATYDELLTIATTSGSTLLNKINTAGQMAAGSIIAESAATPNHTARLAWARAALANPDRAAASLVWPVLYLNRAATKAQVEAATDAQVQSAVDSAVTALAV